MSNSNTNKLKREISVIIPNYNGKALLEKNIPSVIAALAKVPGNHEIIIPDDASSDDSIQYIKLNFPQIKIIENKVNKGFSPNINSGIFKATKELVFALNSDVYLTEDYFSSLMEYFDDETTFGVMGRIVDLNGSKIQDGAKYPYQKGFQIKSTLNFLVRNNPSNYKVATFFLSGANALMDRKKLLEVNGYNEIYAPFYVEDVDLSLRAWRLGWKCYYEHKAVCQHPVSITISKYSKTNFVKTISIRNQIIMQELHLEGIQLLGWKIQLMFNVLTKWITFKSNFYKAFYMYLSLLSQIKKSKNDFKLLQQNKNISYSTTQIIKDIKRSNNDFNIQKF